MHTEETNPEEDVVAEPRQGHQVRMEEDIKYSYDGEGKIVGSMKKEKLQQLYNRPAKYKAVSSRYDHLTEDYACQECAAEILLGICENQYTSTGPPFYCF
ncbi:hypothetical protein CYMTET_39879 [Cymbomonas tetramitiformis]|uniref:Uncharacterized protein n=1 Tax=Cymbomonas tetramitiformis TaxID=36881 RepID=A0AAE0CA99_9CHLO|nr:hypothetical protein CYMTET_39879 [Cymbomonas tetramitiformis]